MPGICALLCFKILRWRHNGRDSISNHQPHDCLLNRLFRRRSKKTSKLRVTDLCAGNSPGTGEFLAQMVSNAENVSIWWRHHDWLMHKDWPFLLTSFAKVWLLLLLHRKKMNLSWCQLCRHWWYRRLSLWQPWVPQVTIKLASWRYSALTGSVITWVSVERPWKTSWWRHQMETFSAYWPFVRGTHKGQRRGTMMFSLICVWINGWETNREAGDLRRYRASLWRHCNDC